MSIVNVKPDSIVVVRIMAASRSGERLNRMAYIGVEARQVLMPEQGQPASLSRLLR